MRRACVVDGAVLTRHIRINPHRSQLLVDAVNAALGKTCDCLIQVERNRPGVVAFRGANTSGHVCRNAARRRREVFVGVPHLRVNVFRSTLRQRQLGRTHIVEAHLLDFVVVGAIANQRNERTCCRRLGQLSVFQNLCQAARHPQGRVKKPCGSRGGSDLFSRPKFCVLKCFEGTGLSRRLQHVEFTLRLALQSLAVQVGQTALSVTNGRVWEILGGQTGRCEVLQVFSVVVGSDLSDLTSRDRVGLTIRLKTPCGFFCLLDVPALEGVCEHVRSYVVVVSDSVLLGQDLTVRAAVFGLFVACSLSQRCGVYWRRRKQLLKLLLIGRTKPEVLAVQVVSDRRNKLSNGQPAKRILCKLHVLSVRFDRLSCALQSCIFNQALSTQRTHVLKQAGQFWLGEALFKLPLLFFVGLARSLARPGRSTRRRGRSRTYSGSFTHRRYINFFYRFDLLFGHPRLEGFVGNLPKGLQVRHGHSPVDGGECNIESVRT